MKKIFKYIFVGFISFLPIVPFLDIVSFLFKSVSDDVFIMNTSKFIIFIILALFATGILQLIFRWSKLSSFASSIPGHMTAIGILGTFIGIFFGLYNFDVSNLKTSIPLLLEGMKLAFTTSIAGLASSTILRVSHTLVVSISDEPDPWGASDESVEVNIPGFQGYSATALGALLTLVEKTEKIEKELSHIHDFMKKTQASLAKAKQSRENDGK